MLPSSSSSSSGRLPTGSVLNPTTGPAVVNKKPWYVRFAQTGPADVPNLAMRRFVSTKTESELSPAKRDHGDEAPPQGGLEPQHDADSSDDMGNCFQSPEEKKAGVKPRKSTQDAVVKCWKEKNCDKLDCKSCGTLFTCISPLPMSPQYGTFYPWAAYYWQVDERGHYFR